MSQPDLRRSYAERLAGRLPAVQGEIARAAQAAGRRPDGVQLIAVTKGHPVEAIEAARSVGLRAMGENRVAELATKVAQLGREGLEWHMIGHVQSRKVGDLLAVVDVVHSVDSVRLGQRFDRLGESGERRPAVLIQVNTSGEAAKGGLEGPGALDVILELAALPSLDVRGLMTMAPFVDDERVLRKTFSDVRRLAEEARRQDPSIGDQLSMGMSNDLRFAVEEGSTMVRIGTALFGPRPGAAGEV
jgi:pyridoxal phosphate enzyme (YggS family)